MSHAVEKHKRAILKQRAKHLYFTLNLNVKKDFLLEFLEMAFQYDEDIQVQADSNSYWLRVSMYPTCSDMTCLIAEFSQHSCIHFENMHGFDFAEDR